MYKKIMRKILDSITDLWYNTYEMRQKKTCLFVKTANSNPLRCENIPKMRKLFWV